MCSQYHVNNEIMAELKGTVSVVEQDVLSCSGNIRPSDAAPVIDGTAPGLRLGEGQPVLYRPWLSRHCCRWLGRAVPSCGGDIGQPVVCCDFREYEPEGLLIGIWASASLLHLTPEEISGVVSRLAGHLNPGGCFYMSFKYGTFSGERDERFYTDLDETSLKGLLDDIPSLSLIRQKITDDVRPDHSGEKWLNVFCRREQTDVFTVPRQ